MSDALKALQTRLDEVRLLGAQDPARSGDLSQTRLSNAVTRSCFVLLSAHFEGFLEDLAVEAIDQLVRESVDVDHLPLLLRALHAEEHLRSLMPIIDRNARAPRIGMLFEKESSLWIAGTALVATMVRPDTVCNEMDNPGSKEVKRFLQLLGVDDVDQVLEASGAKGLLGRINGLVGKRNAVAHGELFAPGTYADVDDYTSLVGTLSKEIDRAVALAVQDMCSMPTAPWAI